MDLLIQVWAGGFYLLNKVFFAFAEGKSDAVKRQLKLIGWSVYILGVPAWIIILVSKNNWIAASIETGGVPSMILGLVTVYYHHKQPNRMLNIVAQACMYIFLVLGVGYSLYDYGGITSVSQVLEMSAMSGFLIGSYLLAKNISLGWVCFMVMNGSVAGLMYIQDKPFLSIQQLVSLCFVFYGFTMAMKTTKNTS